MMETKADNQLVSEYLQALHTRTMTAFENGNAAGAKYLACLCGMWSHTARMGTVNLFESQDEMLQMWFTVGYNASEDSVKMNEQLNAIFAKKAKEEALAAKNTNKK